MRYDEFLAQVRERGEYASRQEAEQTTRVVLGVLAGRLSAGEADDPPMKPVGIGPASACQPPSCPPRPPPS
jgi:hypothetical protein